MKVKVEGCWSGNNNHSWRLSFVKDGKHYKEALWHPDGERWNKKWAGKAKDLLCDFYGLKRDSIRFDAGAT